MVSSMSENETNTTIGLQRSRFSISIGLDRQRWKCRYIWEVQYLEATNCGDVERRERSEKICRRKGQNRDIEVHKW